MRALTRALRHRNYQLFFGGQLISLIGTWMQSVAEAWLVYRLTGSSALLGLAAFFGQVPAFLFATAGGAVADRWNRHRIILVTQTLSMVLPLVLAALTFTHHVRVWHVFALGACLGVVNAFDMPARQSFLVQMVGREDLLNAIALNSSMFNGARVLGPAVAGLLVAGVGEAWCFLINGVSYLAVIGSLLLMDLPTWVPPTRHGQGLRDAFEGFVFVRRTGPARALLLLLAVVSFAGMPYSVLMPIVADGILRAGPRGLGLLMSAAGFGALCGALTLASRRGVRGLGHWVATASAGFGAALVLFSLSRLVWLSAGLLFLVGGAVMVQMASSNTLIQAMVPDRLRGRVMALYAMTFMGMAPLGALIAGSLAEHIGAPRTIAYGGFVCLAAAATFATQLPAIDAEARVLIAEQGLEGGGAVAESDHEIGVPAAL